MKPKAIESNKKTTQTFIFNIVLADEPDIQEIILAAKVVTIYERHINPNIFLAVLNIQIS